MEKAIRVISVERGHDPRDYTLIAFGGAGGLHACELAAALEMRGVLIPVFPGGLSALGILQADVVKELSQTVLLPADELLKESQRLQAIVKRLEEQALRVLDAEGFSRDKMRFQHTLDMRYLGQAYELNISLGRADSIGHNVIAAFHRAHEMRYGYQHKNKKVEIVNVRCRATGITDKPRSQKIAPRSAHPALVTRANPGAYVLRPRSKNHFVPARQPPRRRRFLRPGNCGGVQRHHAHSTRLESASGKLRPTFADAKIIGAVANNFMRKPIRKPDPTRLEIFKNIFHSIAEEMGAVLRRSAFSPNIKERRDYSCAVYDANGEVLAMGDHMPVHLGSMPASVAAARSALSTRARRHRGAERSLCRRHASPGPHHGHARSFAK